MPQIDLSLSEAWRVALAAQGFDRSRPNGRVNSRDLRRTIRQLGLLQTTTVSCRGSITNIDRAIDLDLSRSSLDQRLVDVVVKPESPGNGSPTGLHRGWNTKDISTAGRGTVDENADQILIFAHGNS
jgi:hypothetical protein